MKLINHTLWILSVIIFTTVGLWAFLFYSQLLSQVKSTIDEGLTNHKIAIIDNLKDDNNIVEQLDFLDKSYIIKNVSEDYALEVRDSYKDTLIFSSLKHRNYEARLLTTAFISSDGRYFEMKVLSHELNKGKLIKKIITSLLWLFLFLFISAVLVNRFVLKKTWKPFYKLLEYLNDFRLDKYNSQELSKTNIKEFTLLNESVQKLLNTNVDIFNSQKQFIENASHELQTPLAIGINKLELLTEDPDLSAEQIKKIGNIIESFQRLSGLNKSLLLLSKIENKQFISTETLNFDKIISRIIEDFSDYAEFQKIKITYLKEDEWEFSMNKNLADMLVMNLIKNAIIHNQKEGDIIIHLTSTSFSIENSSNLPQIQANKLFTRFNKNSNNNNSTGLGLAIIKAIVDISDLSIIYSYNNKHVFTVKRKTL
ncbi:HAMP domain-containing sensor histidine kinase [Mariniflexile litorale]|uniref:histidine kinase n=1 Tax=Mariniflexile litorale TaxID=3045158 RepID=A0AAU7EHJ6_9FLAO|nr:HAMP domain-containing sensor histidine kinase [Mariniflexile sp. KMM 9835]MDQ8211746.1 HAMP domain-containing sensor histidine kinase [Mariniflexile sp. KMM 9835]